MAKVLTGKISHPGVAEGEVLLLTEPVSFWGGVDHHGEIIDVHHRYRNFSKYTQDEAKLYIQSIF